jgi:hypothetical protein
MLLNYINRLRKVGHDDNLLLSGFTQHREQRSKDLHLACNGAPPEEKRVSVQVLSDSDRLEPRT